MCRSAARRSGQSSLIALIALPVLFGMLVLLLTVFRTRDSLIELRNGGVAASLAGAEELVHDAFLTNRPELILPVIENAGRTTGEVARQNFVSGKRLEFRWDKAGVSPDISFGVMDQAVGGQFVKVHSDSPSTEWGLVNAIEVTARQPGKPSVFTRVTAVLDQAVIGFRPFEGKPAPVMPVALYRTTDQEGHAGWEEACRTGEDSWAFDQNHKRFSPGHDHLSEVRVRIGRQLATSSGEVCGFPLAIGIESPGEAVEQVRTGLTVDSLSKPGYDGELNLGAETARPIDGDPDLFTADSTDAVERVLLDLAAVGEPRIWPLFSRFDEDGRAELTGFAAARVVTVTRDRGGFVVTLQPCVLASPTAITDPGRLDRNGLPVGNRTVVKVRLAG